MELSSSKIKSKIKKILPFLAMVISSIIFFLYFKEGTFLARKIKKTTLKKFLIFQEMELSSPKLRELFIFHNRTCKA